MIATLFKLNLKALFSGVFLRGAKKAPGAVKTVLLVLLFTYIVASFLFTIGAFFIQLLEPFQAAGIGWMYFCVLGVTVFAACALTSIFTAWGQIFGAKDNEFMLSLPIKPISLLLSRLFVMLCHDYFFSLVIFIPPVFLWVKGGYATAFGLFAIVIGFFLLPLFSSTIALLLAWLLSSLDGVVRHKNIIAITVSLAFLLLYLSAVGRIQGYLGELVARGVELASAFKKSLPPFYAFGQSIAGGDFTQLLIFILWVIPPFTVLCALLSAGYLKILTKSRRFPGLIYRDRELNAGGVIPALVKKELAHYVNSPTVVLNSSLGSVFALAGAVILIVNKDYVYALLNPILSMAVGLSLPLTAALAIIFAGTLNSLSAALISLEGKNLWIVKSMPIPAKNVLLAKVLTHILVSCLPCLLASVIASVVLAKSAPDVATVIIVPQIFLVTNAFVGLVINLTFPRLDWINEVSVVKQSASSVISMLSSMAVVTGLGFLYFFVLKNIMSISAFVYLCAAVFAVCAVVAYKYLVTKGAMCFEQLS